MTGSSLRKRKELPDRQTRLEHGTYGSKRSSCATGSSAAESGSFIEQLTHQMNGFFENAGVFVSRLDTKRRWRLSIPS